MPSPALDDHLGFLQRVEDLTVEQFVAELRIEALTIAVLPGTAWFDVSGLGSHGCNPLADSLGDEPGPLSERMCPGIPRRMNRSESASITSVDLIRFHSDRQAFSRELIDDVEHSILLSVVGAILDEVVGPDMVGIFGPQPDA